MLDVLGDEAGELLVELVDVELEVLELLEPLEPPDEEPLSAPDRESVR